MSAPFYVSPEQWYQDKAEYARKGIARGKPIVAMEYETGIVLMAENRSATLRKISEIYDRIAFGGVGKLDEYENLRKAGVRYADMRGYSFSREDVAGKSLANEYSTVLGSVFTREMKSLEVEILVAEIREDGKSAFYQIRYDGSMTDTTHYVSIGGDGDKLIDVIRGGWRVGLPLKDAARLGRRALAGGGNGASVDDLDERTLEIAILDRTKQGRTFKRISGEEARSLFSG
ncbi:MAG TPA: proteasome subunit alpha [Myxococcota bacterium]|nr:proteasome subunit alpha [Myxococcota bacterium]